MKKYLSFLAGLLFFIVIFLLGEELWDFWKEGENRAGVGQEITNRTLIGWSLIEPYMLYIVLVGVNLILLTWIFRRARKKKLQIENNPLTHGTTVIDGSSIISKKSLPKNEEISEKMTGPFISKEMIEQSKEV